MLSPVTQQLLYQDVMCLYISTRNVQSSMECCESGVVVDVRNYSALPHISRFFGAFCIVRTKPKPLLACCECQLPASNWVVWLFYPLPFPRITVPIKFSFLSFFLFFPPSPILPILLHPCPLLPHIYSPLFIDIVLHSVRQPPMLALLRATTAKIYVSCAGEALITLHYNYNANWGGEFDVAASEEEARPSWSIIWCTCYFGLTCACLACVSIANLGSSQPLHTF